MYLFGTNETLEGSANNIIEDEELEKIKQFLVDTYGVTREGIFINGRNLDA